MYLRDEVERLLLQWDAYEIEHGHEGIVDYDCRPDGGDPDPLPLDRTEVLARLSELLSLAERSRHQEIIERVTADRAYLRALLGEHVPFAEYVRETQGAGAAGWTETYLDQCGESVQRLLDDRGIPWDQSSLEALTDQEGLISAADVPSAIRQAAAEFEDDVRALADTDARFEVVMEPVSEDAFWEYWLNGRANFVRLRINVNRLRLSRVRVRQFAVHELLGHGLGFSSMSERAAAGDDRWVRILSVHCPYQCTFEGLAQALPLFLPRSDPDLLTRTRLHHYLMLVRGQVHIRANTGTSVARCSAYAKARVPFWTDEEINGLIENQTANSLLRSYLWSYPAGMDWFVRLSDAPAEKQAQVIRAAYRQPLTTRQLRELWPDGPPVGGP